MIWLDWHRAVLRIAHELAELEGLLAAETERCSDAEEERDALRRLNEELTKKLGERKLARVVSGVLEMGVWPHDAGMSRDEARALLAATDKGEKP